MKNREKLNCNLAFPCFKCCADLYNCAGPYADRQCPEKTASLEGRTATSTRLGSPKDMTLSSVMRSAPLSLCPHPHACSCAGPKVAVVLLLSCAQHTDLILLLSAIPCLVKETPYFYTETVSSDYSPCCHLPKNISCYLIPFS